MVQKNPQFSSMFKLKKTLKKRLSLTILSFFYQKFIKILAKNYQQNKQNNRR